MQGKPHLRGAFSTLMVFGLTAGTCASAPNDPLADDAEYKLLRATQEVFRTVAAQAAPYLVRIHTVGGTQPRGVIPAPVDSNGEEDSPPSPQPSFQDSPGSSFVVLPALSRTGFRPGPADAARNHQTPSCSASTRESRRR